MRVLHMIERSKDSRVSAMAVAYFSGPADLTEIAKGLHESLGYVEAAKVDTSDKDLAFQKTNTIDRVWADVQDATVEVTGQSKRSTSVGDIIVHDGHVYAVAINGFVRLDINPQDVKTF